MTSLFFVVQRVVDNDQFFFILRKLIHAMAGGKKGEQLCF